MCPHRFRKQQHRQRRAAGAGGGPAGRAPEPDPRPPPDLAWNRRRCRQRRAASAGGGPAAAAARPEPQLRRMRPRQGGRAGGRRFSFIIIGKILPTSTKLSRVQTHFRRHLSGNEATQKTWDLTHGSSRQSQCDNLVDIEKMLNMNV